MLTYAVPAAAEAQAAAQALEDAEARHQALTLLILLTLLTFPYSLYQYKRTNTDACVARHQVGIAAAARRAEEVVGGLQRELDDAETAASQLQERI